MGDQKYLPSTWFSIGILAYHRIDIQEGRRVTIPQLYRIDKHLLLSGVPDHPGIVEAVAGNSEGPAAWASKKNR